MCHKLGHAKFQRSSQRGTFLSSRLNGSTGEEKKICVFQRKTGHISEAVRDRAKVTINN